MGIEVDGAADGAGVVVGARDMNWEVTAAEGESEGAGVEEGAAVELGNKVAVLVVEGELVGFGVGLPSSYVGRNVSVGCSVGATTGENDGYATGGYVATSPSSGDTYPRQTVQVSVFSVRPIIKK